MSIDAFPYSSEAEQPVGDHELSQAEFGSAVEHMYKPREAIFGAVARDMVAKGWSIFPQEMDGRRRPGTVNREMIKWADEHKLATRLPTPQALDLWVAQCAALNVAVVLGPASGHTLVIDIDVVEEELSAQIQEVAEKIFGPTPLRRVGRWPKIALVYRQAPDDEISGRSPKFVPFDTPDNPDRLDQGIEIIASGQPMTFYGKHHKTGRYFTWLDGPPTIIGPEAAPVITSKQINDFLDEVDSIRQFHKAAAFDPSAVSWEWDADMEINIPRIRSAGAATDWIEDENGIVVDGREAYLTRLAFRVVTANPGRTGSEEHLEQLAKIVCDQFMQTAETSGRWKGNSLFNEAKSKVRRTAGKMHSGLIKPLKPAKDDKGNYIQLPSALAYIPPQPRNPNGDSLDFLPDFVDEASAGYDPRNKADIRRPVKCEILEPAEGAFEERAIEVDRTRIADAVSTGLMKAFGSFWDEVYDTDRVDTRIHILKAPTGAGKTSRGIAYIAEDPRTKEEYLVRGSDGEIVHQGRSPILFLMPTYANIEELRSRAQVLNLDGNLSDAELRRQAAERNLIQEDDLPAKLAELRRDAKNAGLETMVYQGKLKAGCAVAEKVEMAMLAGLGTSGFCKAEVPTGTKDADGKPEKEEKFCPHYFDFKGTGEKCPAIKQKEDIEKSHVVFMPHAFLSLSIPEELKHVRAVVADERIHHLFLHTTTFELDSLGTPRKPPKLTKAEKEADVDPTQFRSLRQAAVDVASRALLTEKCPAEELAKIAEVGPNLMGEMEAVADTWVTAALRSCGASLQKDGEITPDIDFETLEAMCNQPTGHQVREEHRFWSIVQERMQERRQELVNEGLVKEGFPAIPRSTRGDRDMRIQLVSDLKDDGEPKYFIRISWREMPNWVDRPLLLLDASAAPEMIGKIWAGKEVVTHDIPAALNVRVVCIADRTYSNSSVIAPPSASPAEKVASAKLLTNVKKALSTVSALYGWSRVVAGGSILVRRAVNTSWEGPHNVDWCHYGAMRGLDFAKHHAAAISVGRMELPVRTLDGLVAALTYDDDQPEQPFDFNGNGLDRANLPLRIPTGVQRVRMRSGHDINLPVPMFPGRWGRMIQRQYREEELLQFLGRLRPVYREGDAPIWFSLSSVIPEEVIVDDIISMDDLVKKGYSVWEAMRRCHGILDERLAALFCDDIFSSPGKAAYHMKKHLGINSRTGEVPKRIGWALAVWHWKADDGTTGHSFVRGEVDNHEEALRNAFRSCLDMELVELRCISETKGQTLARGRKSDKIEDELGTLEDRAASEKKLILDSAIEILMNTPAEAIEGLREERKDLHLPVSFSAGLEDDDNPRAKDTVINMLEADTQLTLKRFWQAKGYDTTPKPVKAGGGMKIDLGAEAALEHARTGIETDNGYAAAGSHTSDGKSEFDILTFDEQDIEIPW